MVEGKYNVPSMSSPSFCEYLPMKEITCLKFTFNLKNEVTGHEKFLEERSILTNTYYGQCAGHFASHFLT